MPDRPYNPLDRVNLARSVEITLLQRPCEQLPLAEPFNGAGLYAIYYTGDFRAYRPISADDCLVPIYVGKADPPGARRGLVDPSVAAAPVLFNRIADHAWSVDMARNLDVADFKARYLVVEDIFIGMGEQLLIQQFRPLWNVHLSGFGLHDPGRRRHGGNRSEWDQLHPGRPWEPHMRQVTTARELTARIRAAFRSGEAASIARMAATSPPVQAPAAPLPEAPEVTE